MKHIVIILFAVFALKSCKNAPVDIKGDAIVSANKILRNAKSTGLDQYKKEGLKPFNTMDSIKYKTVISGLTEQTALLWYEADVVSLLSSDCLTKPSEILSDEIKKSKAIKDSIYHSVLVEKMTELKKTDRLNYFDHKDFFVYFEELKGVSKELRKYCSDEFNTKLDKMIKKEW